MLIAVSPALFSVEESTDLPEAVHSVVTTEMERFLNGKSAKEFNERFLENNSNLVERRISGELYASPSRWSSLTSAFSGEESLFVM